jgi:hypothetical protein
VPRRPREAYFDALRSEIPMRAKEHRTMSIRYGHHLEVAARIIYYLKALPFDEALDVLAIVCRCVTDRNIQGRFWRDESDTTRQ